LSNFLWARHSLEGVQVANNIMEAGVISSHRRQGATGQKRVGPQAKAQS